MFDIRAIRKEPEFFDKAWARRGLEPQTPQILALDTQWRDGQTKLQGLQQKRKELSKEIGMIKSKGGDADAIMAEVGQLKDEITALEDRDRELSIEVEALLSKLPNIMNENVPDGADEDDNIEIRKWGEPQGFPSRPPTIGCRSWMWCLCVICGSSLTWQPCLGW